MVLSDKGQKNDRLQDAKSSTYRVFDSDPFVERICQRLQDAVNHDPQERKGQLVFLIEFFHILSALRNLMKFHNRAALAFIICKHFGQLLFIVAGDAVRQDMNGIAVFGHVIAGRLDAGCCICTGNIKIGNAVLLKEGSESLAGQCVTFRLCKDMVGYDIHFRHKLCAMSAGLESPCSCRQIIVLNVNDPQVLFNCPVNRRIDFFDDLFVVFVMSF